MDEHIRSTPPRRGECYWCGRKGWMLGAYLTYEACDEVCARMYATTPLEVDRP